MKVDGSSRKLELIKKEMDEILLRVDALPNLDARSAEELLGHDERGLPE